MKSELESISLCMNSAHTEMNGELIVPISIMKSGVFNGYLKIPEELEKSAKWWDGIPIVIYSEDSTEAHPKTIIVTNQTCRVGQVRNVRWDSEHEKLIGEAYIDMQLCPDWLLNDIQSGGVKGVSGTYFANKVKSEGEKDGKKYNMIEKNYVPNNIAIVDYPACNPKEGCGINVNEKIIKNEGDNMVDTIEDMQKKIAEMEVLMNGLKGELKVKTDELGTKSKELEVKTTELETNAKKLEAFEKAKKEMDFLAQFPEVNREAAKTELLPVFLEDPAKLVMMNSKRLGELLVTPGTVLEQSKGSEYVDLDLETNEDKEIMSMLPDIKKVREMTTGKA